MVEPLPQPSQTNRATPESVPLFDRYETFIAWRFAHIPNVTGLSQPRAIARLQDAGYDTRVQPGPEYSEKIPERRLNLCLAPLPDPQLDYAQGHDNEQQRDDLHRG